MENILPDVDKEKIAKLHKSIGQNIKKHREKKENQKILNGAADETRTRDLRRDRPAF